MSQLLVPPVLPIGRLLEKFPYDVTEIIYKAVFLDTPVGKTPALLIALRSHEEKYKEVLRIFYQTTMVNLGRGKNFYQLRKLKVANLLFVARLEVSFRGNSADPRPNIDAKVQKRIRSMVNLRDLTLDFSLVTQHSVPDYSTIIERWLCNFSRVKCIKLVPNLSPMSSPRQIPVNGLEVPRPNPQVIDALNRAMRVPGRLANITGLNDSCKQTPWDQPSFPGERIFLLFRVYRSWLRSRSVVFHDIWFWEAEQGKTLSWHLEDQDH